MLTIVPPGHHPISMAINYFAMTTRFYYLLRPHLSAINITGGGVGKNIHCASL